MISGQPSDDFPVMEEIVPLNSYSIKSQILKDMIKQTIFSVSVDQSKIILTGELIEIKNNVMRMVAVDMFRISYTAVPLESNCEDCKAIVPSKALGELARMLPNDEYVNIEFTQNRIVFRSDGFTLVSNLLEGEFIRYDQIFNEDFVTSVEINRNDLLNAFERAILVANENKMLPIKLDITNDDMTIRARSDRGETEDGVQCKTDGSDLVISFNPRYFIEALRAIDDEVVLLKFNSQLTPGTIRAIGEDSDYKYLIVPLRPE